MPSRSQGSRDDTVPTQAATYPCGFRVPHMTLLEDTTSQLPQATTEGIMPLTVTETASSPSQAKPATTYRPPTPKGPPLGRGRGGLTGRSVLMETSQRGPYGDPGSRTLTRLDRHPGPRHSGIISSGTPEAPLCSRPEQASWSRGLYRRRISARHLCRSRRGLLAYPLR